MAFEGCRILVTGSDGFIGSHLVERLVARQARVTALSYYNSFDSFGWLSDLPSAILSEITVVRGDVRDPAQMRRLVREHDVVFHLAALIAIPHSYEAAHSYVETNVSGTLNLLEAVREFGIRRFIHTSTSEVYGTAQTTPIAESHPLQGQSPYSASKIGADMMAEAFARSFDLPVVVLRPFNTFGPRQSERAVIPTIIRQVLDPTCAAIQIGATTPERDLTYVNDMVSAFIAAAEGSNLEYGRPYNAGNGSSISVGALIDVIQAIAGVNKRVMHEPSRMRPANSEVRMLLADPTRFSQATGWNAKIPLREGLELTIDWWQKRMATGLVRRNYQYMT